MTRRNMLTGAAIALALVAFTGKRWLLSHEQSATFSAQGAQIVQKAGERGFTLGTLAFAPCELGQHATAATTAAFCAPFKVPENWNQPNGREIDLKLALVRSSAALPDRDPVVLLAGGPGQAATEVYPNAAAGFAPLREHRNILLLDQRGTGGSHPLRCTQIDDDTAADSDVDLARLRAQTQACLDEISRTSDPAQYTTSMAVRDLEAVRQALGAPQFDLVGVSYGTRVAQQYLRRYPDAVRSVVLDSAVPNELVLGSEFAINLDAALKAQFAGCTRTPTCANAFGDPYASLYRLRGQLAARTPTVAFRDPASNEPQSKLLDVQTFATVVRMFAYSSETSALLPLAIDRALKGDYSSLLGQASFLSDELSDLSGNGMQLSVICAEDADRLVDRPQDTKLLLGDALVRAWKEQCAIWPHGSVPADFHKPIASDKPVLILSGEFDPVTPPRYAEEIVKGLRNGRVLVAKSQGHSVMSRGCLPKLVKQFVEKLDPKNLDAGCIADFGPTPAFTSFNGAAP